jgi:hypothetical protein
MRQARSYNVSDPYQVYPKYEEANHNTENVGPYGKKTQTIRLISFCSEVHTKKVTSNMSSNECEVEKQFCIPLYHSFGCHLP